MGYLPHDNNNNNNNKEDNLLVGINRCMVNIKPSRLGVVVKIALTKLVKSTYVYGIVYSMLK